MKKIKLLTGLSALGAIGGGVASIATSCTWHYGTKYDDKLTISINGDSDSTEVYLGPNNILELSVSYDGQPGKVGKIISVTPSDPSVFTVEGYTVSEDGIGTINVTGVKGGEAEIIVEVEDAEGHINKVAMKVKVNGTELDDKLDVGFKNEEGELGGAVVETGQVSDLTLSATYDGQETTIGRIISARSSDPDIFTVESYDETGGTGSIKINGKKTGTATLVVVVEDENGNINKQEIEISVTSIDNGEIDFDSVQSFLDWGKEGHYKNETATGTFGPSTTGAQVKQFLIDSDVKAGQIADGVVTYYSSAGPSTRLGGHGVISWETTTESMYIYIDLNYYDAQAHSLNIHTEYTFSKGQSNDASYFDNIHYAMKVTSDGQVAIDITKDFTSLYGIELHTTTQSGFEQYKTFVITLTSQGTSIGAPSFPISPLDYPNVTVTNE